MTIEQQNQQYETIMNSLSQEKEEIKGYYEDLKPQLKKKWMKITDLMKSYYLKKFWQKK